MNNNFINLDFDSSVNDKDYKKILVDKLYDLLVNVFNGNPQKTKIKDYNNRLTFSCPYCGDSTSNDYKKRGNIILSGKYANHYKCFNCNYYTSIPKFFEEYGENLDLSVLNYIQEHTHKNTLNYKYDASSLFDTELIDNFCFEREFFKSAFKLSEVRGTKAHTYLSNRKQFDYSKFLYDYNNDELIILNNTASGKILACQRRKLNTINKYAPKYRHYKLSKLYTDLNMNIDEIPDEVDGLSSLFNICLVDYNKPITAFEGPLDSFLFKNSIAITGLNKSFILDIPVRYWLDSDNAALKKRIDLLSNGETIFLWAKFLNEYNLPKRNKWDLNDVILYLSNNNINVTSFEPFFSNDMFDMIDL